MRIWLLSSSLLLGCSTQIGDATSPEFGSSRASPELSLPSSQSGRYRISREGRAVGEERYTVTSSAGLWVAQGEIILAWPLEQTQRYRFEYDVKARRPAAFSISLSLLGETQTVTGRNDGTTLAGEVRGIVDPVPYEVAYGPGTMIDFGSPLFSALLFALLSRELESPAPIKVRSIVVPIPFLRPAVLLQELRFAGREGELRKVALGPAGKKPTAYWVRSDGMPTKARTWADEGGAPFVYELEP